MGVAARVRVRVRDRAEDGVRVRGLRLGLVLRDGVRVRGVRIRVRVAFSRACLSFSSPRG